MIEPTSINESKYAITYADDYSELIVVYLLKDESQAANVTERFLTYRSRPGNSNLKSSVKEKRWVTHDVS